MDFFDRLKDHRFITLRSCRFDAANAAWLQLHCLAHNLGNSLLTLATSEPIKVWTLMTREEDLLKIGAKVVSHARYVALQMAPFSLKTGGEARLEGRGRDIFRFTAPLEPTQSSAYATGFNHPLVE